MEIQFIGFGHGLGCSIDTPRRPERDPMPRSLIGILIAIILIIIVIQLL